MWGSSLVDRCLGAQLHRPQGLWVEGVWPLPANAVPWRLTIKFFSFSLGELRRVVPLPVGSFPIWNTSSVTTSCWLSSSWTTSLLSRKPLNVSPNPCQPNLLLVHHLFEVLPVVLFFMLVNFLQLPLSTFLPVLLPVVHFLSPPVPENRSWELINFTEVAYPVHVPKKFCTLSIVPETYMIICQSDRSR